METKDEILTRIDELNCHKQLLPKWYYKQRLMFLTIKFKLLEKRKHRKTYM